MWRLWSLAIIPRRQSQTIIYKKATNKPSTRNMQHKYITKEKWKRSSGRRVLVLCKAFAAGRYIYHLKENGPFKAFQTCATWLKGTPTPSSRDWTTKSLSEIHLKMRQTVRSVKGGETNLWNGGPNRGVNQKAQLCRQ